MSGGAALLRSPQGYMGSLEYTCPQTGHPCMCLVIYGLLTLCSWLCTFDETAPSITCGTPGQPLTLLCPLASSLLGIRDTDTRGKLSLLWPSHASPNSLRTSTRQPSPRATMSHPSCFSAGFMSPGGFPKPLSTSLSYCGSQEKNKIILLIYISPEIMNSYRDANCTGVENEPTCYMESDAR